MGDSALGDVVLLCMLSMTCGLESVLERGRPGCGLWYWERERELKNQLAKFGVIGYRADEEDVVPGCCDCVAGCAVGDAEEVEFGMMTRRASKCLRKRRCCH